MPSPLTGPYQFGVGSLLAGDGTANPEVSLLSVSGLGPVVLGQVAPRSFSPGAAVGTDVSGARDIDLEVEIWTPGDDEAAGAWWVTLTTEFDAMETGTGSLWLWLPGIGHREIIGRPRGTSDDGLVSLPYGYVAMTLRWLCTAGSLGADIEEEP
jgi:hypothetical protein